MVNKRDKVGMEGVPSNLHIVPTIYVLWISNLFRINKKTYNKPDYNSCEKRQYETQHDKVYRS